jgi:hypothetical protein
MGKTSFRQFKVRIQRLRGVTKETGHFHSTIAGDQSPGAFEKLRQARNPKS